MAGRTVSAYTDEATAAKVADIARLEDRSPAQIAAAALRFYVRLPSAARDAWRRAEANGEPAVADETAWEVGRAILDKQWNDAVRAGLARYQSPLPPDASEEDILAYAVQITRRR
jgi:predicted transcriptional regulator